MSELSRSSAIRNYLDELGDDEDSDNSDILSDITDFSSGSGNLYQPNLSDFDSSDFDESDDEIENPVIDDSDGGNSTDDAINQVGLHLRQNWVRTYPPEEPLNVETKFKVRNPGIKNCPPRNSPPLSYFYLFFTVPVWNLLTRETNKYAREQIQNKSDSGNLGPQSRFRKWVDVTVADIKKFIALIINMGLNPKNNIKKYWGTSRAGNMPYFRSTMSRNFFQLLSSLFHVSSTPYLSPEHPNHDPWHKIRPFLDSINDSFKKYFIPSQNISIDESMIGMKNRFVHIVYMPNKRHARFGVKKFEVVDSKYSYTLHTELYCGRRFLADCNDPFTEKVIMYLLTASNLLNKGYHIFTDNFYTKLPLAQRLLDNGTFLTGTINKNSKDLCKTALNTQLRPQTSIYFRKNDTLMVGYKEKSSRKPVYLISTGSHAEDKIIRSRNGKENNKPVMINQYNLNMGGVDNKDKSIYHLTCDRPSQRYWKKIFFNLLDMTLFNAYILYSINTDKPLEREDFYEKIVEDMIDEVTVNNNIPPGPAGDTGHQLSRLAGQRMRLCLVCSGPQKKSRSHFWCPGCNCGVHPHCYHKLEHFWRPNQTGRKRKHQSDSEDETN